MRVVMNKTHETKKEKVTGAVVRPRIKLTLHTGERFFGPGICELLEQIDSCGSILSASKEMGMSYTKAWKILNRAEQEMNMHLIVRNNGGKNGGSSILTREGREAIKCYREMEKALERESERLLENNYSVFRKREDD